MTHYGERLHALFDHMEIHVGRFCAVNSVSRNDLYRWMDTERPRLGKTFIHRLAKTIGWSFEGTAAHLGQTAAARKSDAAEAMAASIILQTNCRALKVSGKRAFRQLAREAK